MELLGSMSEDSDNPSRRLNFVISGWICIVIGTGVFLSETSDFAISIAVTISLGGLSVLIFGLSLDSGTRGLGELLPEEEE